MVGRECLGSIRQREVDAGERLLDVSVSLIRTSASDLTLDGRLAPDALTGWVVAEINCWIARR